MRLNKRFITAGFIGLELAAILVYALQSKDDSFTIDLSCLREGGHIDFVDDEGYTWTIEPSPDTEVRPDLALRLVFNVLVTSSSPRFRNAVGCSRERRPTIMATNLLVKEGSEIIIRWAMMTETFTTPKIAAGSLKHTPVD